MPIRLVFCLLAPWLCLACIDLNYPEPVQPDTAANANVVEAGGSAGGGAAPDSMSADTGAAAETSGATEAMAAIETGLAWNDLTALAREDRQSGNLDQARENLALAALQLQELPPSSIRRRTVFGLQAWLAMDFAEADRIAEADEFADELFAEAEAEPELGGASLVSLAQSVADRRAAAAGDADSPFSRLDLLRIALRTAQAGPANRERLELAAQVAGEAYREDALDLARDAIDQALADSMAISPTRRGEIAEIQVFKARIALAQGDLESAEAAAVAANVIFDAISAGAAQRGAGEALLAEALTRQGDIDRALTVARGAHARLDLGETIDGPTRRQILAALARVERQAGDLEAARAHYEEALAIEASEAAADEKLVAEIAAELQEIAEPESPSSADE